MEMLVNIKIFLLEILKLKDTYFKAFNKKVFLQNEIKLFTNIFWLKR